MDILSEYEHTLTSQSWMMNKYFSENQGYIRASNAKEIIQRARQRFQSEMLLLRGPPSIPTLFRNHPKRYEFVRERENKKKGVRSPKHPPELPPFRTTFFEDMYMNLLCNIRLNEYKGFIKHGELAKLVCLKREYCAEDALMEMLSPEPSFYTRDLNKGRRSKYLDTAKENWGPLPTECKTSYMYSVDFAFLLPENLFSTVTVNCMECGKLFETIFCDSTKEVIKRDVLYNVSQIGITSDSSDEEEAGKKDQEKGTDVIRLQPRGLSTKGCPFAEGLIGIKPLTAVKVYARCRLTMYCTRSSPIGLVLHEQYVEPGLLPTYDQFLDIYQLDQR